MGWQVRRYRLIFGVILAALTLLIARSLQQTRAEHQASIRQIKAARLELTRSIEQYKRDSKLRQEKLLTQIEQLERRLREENQ